MPFVRFNAKMSGTKSMCQTWLTLLINPTRYLTLRRLKATKEAKVLENNQIVGKIGTGTRYLILNVVTPIKLPVTLTWAKTF